MTNSYEAKNALSLIVQMFKKGDLPEKIKLAYIEDPDPNKPMRKYSLFNKMLIYAQGTTDARGSNQWKLVNREVNFSKHPYKVNILSPRFAYACKNCSEKQNFKIRMNWKGKEGFYSKYECPNCPNTFVTNQKDKSKVTSILDGFQTIGLYKKQDTEGEPLPTYKPEKLPNLIEVAHNWGIALEYEPPMSTEYGYTNGKKNCFIM